MPDRHSKDPRSKKPALSICLLLALVTGFGTGCVGRLGPNAVRLTRTHYNIAAQETSAQELLLNLVRLRYRDTPYFLQIASLSTNMSARAGFGSDATFPSSGPQVGSISGSVTLEESPTITYTPLVGDRFVSELLKPVETDILLLLSHAGWSMDRLLRLLVQEIDGIPNAPTASGPTPDSAPVFEDFLRVSELFRILQSRRQVALIRGSLPTDRSSIRLGAADATGTGVLLRFTAEGRKTAEFSELAQRLQLESDRAIFEIVAGIGDREPGRINVVLRSVLSTLFYASHGIDVPEDDRALGRVTTTLDKDGEAFDWGRLTGTLLRVASGVPESIPYISVRYRGNTFYIDDSDRDSKSTFSMLNLVLALQSGGIPAGGPILTLPVSR